MTELRNCFIAIVSLHCDDDDNEEDDDCVITDNNNTGGRWLIGDPATNRGGLETEDPAGDKWPHQVRAWQYSTTTSGGWQSDPLLTVTGNIEIFSDLILILILYKL